MLLANEKNNIALISFISFIWAIGHLGKTINIQLLAIIPNEYKTLYLILSIVLFTLITCFYKVAINHYLLFYLWIICFYSLFALCVNYTPNYLPNEIKYIVIIMAFLTAFLSILDIKLFLKFKYSYQFYIISYIKLYITFYFISRFLYSINMSFYDIKELLFAGPYVILIILTIKVDSQNKRVLFFSLFFFSFIALCAINYIFYNDAFIDFSFCILIFILCFLYQRMMNRWTTYALIILFILTVVSFYINFFYSLSELINTIITIASALISILSIISIFIDTKKKNINNVVLGIIKNYSCNYIDNEFRKYIFESKDSYIESYFCNSVLYAKDHNITSFSKNDIDELISIIQEENGDDNSDIKKNEGKHTNSDFIKIINSVINYGKLIIACVIFVILIIINSSGFHNFIVQKYAESDNIPYLYDTIYYANTYSTAILDKLSDDPDISNCITFHQYLANIYLDRAIEYKFNEKELLYEKTISQYYYHEGR